MQVTNSQQSSALCLAELSACRRLSIGPSFVLLAGQKYGYRPLPATIPGVELQRLLGALRAQPALAGPGEGAGLLERWYLTDTHALPHQAVLQPVTALLPHFLNQKEPGLQARDAQAWWAVQARLQELLRAAATGLLAAGEFTEDQAHNYFMSQPERETQTALQPCGEAVRSPRDSCLLYHRHITNINLQNTARAGAFIDLQERRLDSEAGRLLGRYRDRAEQTLLDSGGITKRFTVEWVGRDGLNPDTHKDYLSDFVNHFYKNVIRLVDRAMKKENIGLASPLVYEVLHHLHVCQRAGAELVGREEELARLQEYLSTATPPGSVPATAVTPFLVAGPGGAGKTALLSRAALLAREWAGRGAGRPLLLLRYCGATPASSSTALLLSSLCRQISYNLSLPLDPMPTELSQLAVLFRERLGLASAQQPILVLLDGLEQLRGEGRELAWLPTSLSSHCRLVTSLTHDPAVQSESQDCTTQYSLLAGRAPHSSFVLDLAPLEPGPALQLIQAVLAANQRRLGNFHTRVVLNALEQCRLPLFCRLVAGEVRLGLFIHCFRVSAGVRMAELRSCREGGADPEPDCQYRAAAGRTGGQARHPAHQPRLGLPHRGPGRPGGPGDGGPALAGRHGSRLAVPVQLARPAAGAGPAMAAATG